MKIRSINYQRTYNTGNYSSLRVGAEIELEDTDTPEEAFAKAKEITEAEYKSSFTPSEVLPFNYQPTTFSEPIPEIQVEEEPTTPDTRTKEQKQIDLINSFTTLPKPDGLESMFLVVKNNPVLLETYNNKHAELLTNK